MVDTTGGGWIERVLHDVAEPMARYVRTWEGFCFCVHHADERGGGELLFGLGEAWL
jgi:hypothetical protein